MINKKLAISTEIIEHELLPDQQQIKSKHGFEMALPAPSSVVFSQPTPIATENVLLQQLKFQPST